MSDSDFKLLRRMCWKADSVVIDAIERAEAEMTEPAALAAWCREQITGEIGVWSVNRDRRFRAIALLLEQLPAE